MRLRENIELEYFPVAMAAKMCDYLTFLQIFISFKVVYFGLEQQKEKEFNSLVISFYPIYNINNVITYTVKLKTQLLLLLKNLNSLSSHHPAPDNF